MLVTKGFVQYLCCTTIFALVKLTLGEMSSSTTTETMTNHINLNKQCSTHQEDFQQVTELLPTKLYIYSAYDRELGAKKTTRNIVILGIVPRNLSSSLQCNFYNSNQTLLYSTLASIKHTKIYPGQLRSSPSEGYPYDSSSKIHCPIRDKQMLPSFVGLTTSDHKNDSMHPSNCLPIQNLPKNRRKIEFAACVPTTYNYDNLAQFLEWIEFQALMGVSHFTFYNHSIGPQVSCDMRSYGCMVDVLPFANYNLSTGDPQSQAKGRKAIKGFSSNKTLDVYCYNNALALDNCLYRYRGRAKYVVFFDLDEMVVPKLDSTYGELLHRVNQEHHSNQIASYRFFNQYFYKFHPDHEMEVEPASKNIRMNQELDKLTINRKTTRTDCNGFEKVRLTKCIFRPDKVYEVNLHRALKMKPGYQQVFVPERYAILQHYRTKRREWSKCESYVNDTSGHRFVNQFAERIENKLKQIGDLCNLTPNIFNN